MIVLDEEATLAGCLQSLQPVVDEIVILVDDRTTDHSRDIARSHGARVSTFRWKQDFSRARNQALDQVRTDWVLYIDADERLQPGARSVLEEALGDPETLAVRLLLRPRAGWTRMWLLRIFRNDPRIRFAGIAHGRISPSVNQLVSMKAGIVRNLPVSIEHLGYEDEMEKLKSPARIPLYLTSVEVQPQDPYLWRSLGISYLSVGALPEAFHAWGKSLEVIRARVKTDSPDALTYYDMIQCLMEQDEDPCELVEEMSQRFPDYPTTLWLRARSLMRQGEFAESVPLLERLVELGKTRGFDRALSYDSRIFNLFAYGCLGICFFQARQFKKAERYFRRALREGPGNMELRLKAELSSRKAASLERPRDAGHRNGGESLR